MPFKAFPETIQNLKLFAGISEQARNELLSEGSLLHLEKGKYLFHRGDPIKYFYIVCSGTMQLVRETPGGKEITKEILSKGKTIGKADILQHDHTHHRIGALAATDAVVLEFPASWLKKFCSIPPSHSIFSPCFRNTRIW